MAKRNKVITATLIRGKVYVYKNERFEYGTPKEVTNKMAAELEEIFDEVLDTDGEMFEKDYFDIDYDAEKPVTEAASTRKSRKAADKKKVVRRRPIARDRSGAGSAGFEEF